MNYFAIALAGSLAACASHSAPPSASADSVQAATNTPSAAIEVVPVDAHWPRASAASTPQPSEANRTGASAAMDNAAALPAPSAIAGSYEADNSRAGFRDRSGTPPVRSAAESDLRVTQLIREAVVADGSLSVMAKNVKIITIDGKVTLRGFVKTEHESMTIAAAAKRVAGDAQVENFLEVH